MGISKKNTRSFLALFVGSVTPGDYAPATDEET